ncbi:MULTISPECIES: hypothetical protein [unclassified Pseudomonas]|uniref:hypothetical protein n=1 Tax=unclassified Pseudomonas TaxID=196821 RepID=UPI000BC9AEF4|nr:MULTISPECIES: hypothetical protein [unclassified Pseudomonas]PVZ12575.1 hypothetical protein F474_03374 [Pseudomonas sp. URIL14HWK12:I12]PVZ23273.1 hypothetical protein F470_02828 [Pseudomonas sp. URIL14HWK12:I10]PVZ32603.1 hypothetical protein F472_03176 [Pseudomonas sp. URIL14HWK12:I11]SNZ13755.1 hypothetical protein SAMN05660463_02525 [Pseudomonas sp. URIL14HWK12:I9]
MKWMYLLVPLTVLGPSAGFAATSPLQAFLTCDADSLAIVNQPGLKERIPSTEVNGKVRFSGGSKTSLGERWMFDTPITLEGVTLTGFFIEDQDLMGSRIIGSGFYTQQAPDALYEQLKKMPSSQLESAHGIYARAQIWSHKQSGWVAENGDELAGKLVTDTAERVLMVEPAAAEVGHGSKGMITCSIQGNVTPAMLKTTRPDLIE